MEKGKMGDEMAVGRRGRKGVGAERGRRRPRGGKKGTEAGVKAAKRLPVHSPEIVKQALVQKDRRMLQGAINTRNSHVARSTVNQLSPRLAVRLFEQLSSLSLSTPTALPTTSTHLVWLRQVLIGHPSTLATSAMANKCMKVINSHFGDRLRYEEPLMRIQGLLDTAGFQVDKQIQFANLAAKMMADCREPLVVHVEGSHVEILDPSQARDEMAKTVNSRKGGDESVQGVAEGGDVETGKRVKGGGGRKLRRAEAEEAVERVKNEEVMDVGPADIGTEKGGGSEDGDEGDGSIQDGEAV